MKTKCCTFTASTHTHARVNCYGPTTLYILYSARVPACRLRTTADTVYVTVRLRYRAQCEVGRVAKDGLRDSASDGGGEARAWLARGFRSAFTSNNVDTRQNAEPKSLVSAKLGVFSLVHKRDTPPPNTLGR